MTGRSGSWPRTALRPEMLTAALIFLLIAFFAIFPFATLGLMTVYVVFVLATIAYVRTVPVEPGGWLGRRTVRRSLVVVIVLLCVALTVTPYMGLAAGGILLLILLGFSDVLLGRATQRIATAFGETIDERQEALRNRAHRLAYWILALAVGGTALIAYVANPAWFGKALWGSLIVPFFQLLLFLPTMAIAWLEPDRLLDEETRKRPGTLRVVLATTMVAVSLLTPVVLALGLAVLPVRTSAFVRAEASAGGHSCKYFWARKDVGLGTSAVIPLTAMACWDGHTAFENWGLNASDCHPSQTVLATVSTAECRRTTQIDGTLHFRYHAVVRSAVLPFLTRDVVVTLALAPDGTVVQFP